MDPFMRYKILIHAPNLSTPGGKQTYFASLKNHFNSDIEFFFYGSQGKPEMFIMTPYRLLKDYWKFYSLLKKNPYDLVHLNPSLNAKSFFRDSIFALICKLTQVRFTVFWHGWQWGFENKVVSKIVPWFKFTFGKANSMIVLAQEFANQLKKYEYKKSIFQVTTVADPIFFTDADNVNPVADPKNNSKIKLLFLSRIERVKGLYETLDAFCELKKGHNEFELVIAGTGKELEAAKNYVEINAIKEVEFLGWVTGASKLEAFKQADIYLLPSYHGEGLPCSILEAMAVGLPVVSTDVGGIKDFFEDGKMGYLVEMKNPSDICTKLNLLIKEPQRISNMGNYNRQYARQRFTPKEVSTHLESIYRKTILD